MPADVTKTIVVSLAQGTVTIGGTTQATATITSAVSDNALDAQPVQWSSSAITIATVDTAGLVKGVAAGTASIKARAGNVEGTAPLTVQGLPVITITAQQEADIMKVPAGGQFIERGPTQDILCQVAP